MFGISQVGTERVGSVSNRTGRAGSGDPDPTRETAFYFYLDFLVLSGNAYYCNDRR